MGTLHLPILLFRKCLFHILPCLAPSCQLDLGSTISFSGRLWLVFLPNSFPSPCLDIFFSEHFTIQHLLFPYLFPCLCLFLPLDSKFVWAGSCMHCSPPLLTAKMPPGQSQSWTDAYCSEAKCLLYLQHQVVLFPWWWHPMMSHLILMTMLSDKCCQAHFIDEETEAQKMGLHSVEMAFEMNSEQEWVPAANGNVITQLVCWGGGTGPQTFCICYLHCRITLGFPLNLLLGNDTASTDHCLQAWGQPLHCTEVNVPRPYVSMGSASVIQPTHLLYQLPWLLEQKVDNSYHVLSVDYVPSIARQFILS